MLIGNCFHACPIIVDPFVGVGTTLIAAAQNKQKAIGIELREENCQIAIRRLKLFFAE
jgi:DNA modification methylase